MHEILKSNSLCIELYIFGNFFISFVGLQSYLIGLKPFFCPKLTIGMMGMALIGEFAQNVWTSVPKNFIC